MLQVMCAGFCKGSFANSKQLHVSIKSLSSILIHTCMYELAFKGLNKAIADCVYSIATLYYILQFKGIKDNLLLMAGACGLQFNTLLLITLFWIWLWLQQFLGERWQNHRVKLNKGLPYLPVRGSG